MEIGCLLLRVLLVLDNRDSFTFNLVQALSDLGAEVLVKRSDAIGALDVCQLEPERVLIGPGPGDPGGAGCSLAVLDRLDPRVPLLGVCLGHQALGQVFGARLGPARDLIHGRAVAVEHDGRGVFTGVPSPSSFTRYNSLALVDAGLPACLEVSARTTDGEIAGLRHRSRPWEGVQFHPESILSEEGRTLLRNFLSLR